MEQTRTKQYWINIAKFLGAILLLVLILIGAYLVIRSYQFAKQTMSPPRIAIQNNPGDFGIPEYENVTFTTEDGIRLEGWYIAPTAQNGWVILFTHGYADNRANLLPEAKNLTDKGHGVLLFDFRGHGESGDALVTFGDRERLDIVAAVDFIADRSDGGRLGAFGFSMGAGALTVVAAEDERLEAVILVSGIPTLEDELRYRARAYWLFSQIPALAAIRGEGVQVDDVRPIDRLCAISPRKVLLIYGELDDAVPPETAQDMYAAACEGAELWLIHSAGHANFIDIVPDEYPARIVDFFK
jgi:pimeloyl-ACP methyl ester carboxylesterase